MQEFIVSKSDSLQVSVKYLKRILKEAPLSFLYKEMRKKNITLNGRKMTGNEKLNENDSIKIFMTDETIAAFRGVNRVDTSIYETAFSRYKTPEILYEDRHVILAVKPVGMLSQQGNHKDLSINEWLIGYLLAGNAVTAASLCEFTPSVCNRLDRNTGGIILFAKTVFGANHLNALLKDRTLGKYYFTIVSGKLDKAASLEGYLCKDETSNKVRIEKKPFEGADYINTVYEPVKYSPENNLTLLSVKLVTGKPHQIRAHLASINHPIIGDFKYGDSNLNKRLGLKNQFLYAVKVVFPAMDDYPELSMREITYDVDTLIQKYF